VGIATHKEDVSAEEMKERMKSWRPPPEADLKIRPLWLKAGAAIFLT